MSILGRHFDRHFHLVWFWRFRDWEFIPGGGRLTGAMGKIYTWVIYFGPLEIRRRRKRNTDDVGTG